VIPKWLTAAFIDLGEQEVAGPGANPRIAEYLKAVGLPGDDDIPWCAAAVGTWLVEGGIVGTDKANAKSYLEWGVRCAPRLGAVAVMNRGPDPAKGHVALVADFHAAEGLVYLIGGNQGNRVGLDLKYVDRILDFRFPVVA